MVKYGNTLESSRKDGRLANTDNIYDKRTGEMQEAINQKIANVSPADEEDLTKTIDEEGHSVTKFADRSYSPSTFVGKGYKILRKNIQKVYLAVVNISVSTLPSSDGYVSFIINGIETHVDLVASTDNSTSLVAEKIASKLAETMAEYEVSYNASSVTLIRKFGGEVSFASSFSANSTGVTCTVSDSTKSELRNIMISDMVNTSNTTYEIRYDFDLNGEIIEIPDGCTLKFDGGSLKNGTMTGNNTIIDSRPYRIFKSIILNGTYNCISCPEWFHSIYDMFAKSTFNNIRCCEEYHITEPIHINRDNITINGDGHFFTNASSVFYLDNCNNINISHLSFISDGKSDCAVFCKVVNNLTIDNCKCTDINLIGTTSGANDSYLETTKEKSNNYFSITNNSGKNKNPNIKNQAIRLVFVNNFIVSGNNFEGYYNGCLAWGGDCAYYCRSLEEERKCKDGIIINNVFSNCISAGVWTGCAERINIANNIITSNNSKSMEGLDAEGSANIVFSNNVVRGFGSAFCLFGNVDNILFKGNDVILNDSDGYILQCEPVGIDSIYLKNGEVTLQDNKVLTNVAKMFSYQGKGIVCENNTIYNAYDNSGTIGGYERIINNTFIYNVSQQNKKGMLRTMKFVKRDDVISNFGEIINNRFVNENQEIIYYALLLSSQSIEGVTLEISHNCFENIEECIRALSDSNLKYRIKFRNNTFSENIKYTLSSSVDMPNSLIEWNKNTYTDGNEVNDNCFYNSDIRDRFYNFHIAKGSKIGIYDNDDGYTMDCWIAVQDGRMTDRSNYRRNLLQIAPRRVDKTSDLPQLDYSERGAVILDASSGMLLYWNGSSWRKDHGGSTDKTYGIKVNSANECPGSQFFRTDLHKPIFNDRDNGYYVDADGNRFDLPRQGPSTNRPSNVNFGFIYKDTTINKMIIWDGSSWVNMDGTALN